MAATLRYAQVPIKSSISCSSFLIHGKCGTFPVLISLNGTRTPSYVNIQMKPQFSSIQLRTYARVVPPSPDENHDKVQDQDKSEQPVQHDPELLNLLHSYPENPRSPYEILGFKDRHKFKDKKQLRARFYQLAKIYHPDTRYFEGVHLRPTPGIFHTNLNIVKNKAKKNQSDNVAVLTQEIKSNRFKSILAAYTLLKHPLNKENYDNYGIGWEKSSPANLYTHNKYKPSTSTTTSTHNSHTYAYTGNWEEYQNYRKKQQNNSYGWHDANNNWAGGATHDSDVFNEFYANRKRVFTSLFVFFLAYMGLQFVHILMYDDYIGGTNNESLTASLRMHEKSQNDLRDAYVNFGFGGTKDERVNRFLWFRKLSHALAMGDVAKILEFLEGERVSGNKSILDNEGKFVKFTFDDQESGSNAETKATVSSN